MLDVHGVTDDLPANLRLALRIELSVIPPYLYALWSIRTPAEGAGWAATQAAAAIRSVVYEEMLHAALVVNLLHALGEDVTELAPMRYPGILPGHVVSGPDAFTVTLRPLDRDALSVFMTIEKPDFDGPSAGAGAPWTSLAAFYARIREQIQQLTDKDFGHGRQMQPSGNPGAGTLVAVSNRETADEAVRMILLQGEGSPPDPDGTDPSGELDGDHEVAHYYQFQTIDGYVAGLNPAAIITPVRDLHAVVADPHRDLYSAEQRTADDAFNATYAQMLAELLAAFKDPSPQPFGRPSESMRRLTAQAAWLRSLGPVISPRGQSLVAGPTFDPGTGEGL